MPKALHHAVINHRLAARAAFLSGLEDHHHGPVKIADFPPDAAPRPTASPCDHRARRRASLPSVWDLCAAGRGFPGSAGRPCPPAGQRSSRCCLPSPADHAHHAGATDPGDNLVQAKCLQLVGHQSRRSGARRIAARGGRGCRDATRECRPECSARELISGMGPDPLQTKRSRSPERTLARRSQKLNLLRERTKGVMHSSRSCPKYRPD